MRIILKLVFIVFGLGLIAFMLFLDEQTEEYLIEEMPTVGDDTPSYIEENAPEEEVPENNSEAVEEELHEEDAEEEQIESEEVTADRHGEPDEEQSRNGVTLGEPFYDLIGENTDVLVNQYGEPDRTEPSQYGYNWYVWNESDRYVQAGVEEGRIVTIYTNVPNDQTAPFNLGDSYDRLEEEWTFEREAAVSGDFQFTLSPREIQSHPLVEIDGVWVQLYFDTFEEELSSIRFIEAETLVKQQPYSLTYRGSLPEKPALSEEEWEKVEEGMARQIFDLTNNFREKHSLPPLDWDEDTSLVAYGHSKDMRDNGYFSHQSPTRGDLGERLTNGGVQYQRAAENIAARYVDAASAMEGWLNSEGHRVNLMNEDLSHLGVGVHRDFYTQNFMTPW
ncbi:CAP domain-containing protein [Alteribacter keqinensis]|uniref:Cysteine-rich secretory protein family protein n=1 Tax=Alteribacter keqinensis TaxID=2483800 RepID=A0A3M7TVT4_9BACI|nr:CAP domain-containing protein [Alteribacter keqinensis]RNA69717.1 hypothetical protein EBO34_07215 [Alteribacter keqinensis]